MNHEGECPKLVPDQIVICARCGYGAWREGYPCNRCGGLDSRTYLPVEAVPVDKSIDMSKESNTGIDSVQRGAEEPITGHAARRDGEADHWPGREGWKDRAEKAEDLIFAIAGGDAVLVNVADLNAVRLRAERAEDALAKAVAFGKRGAEDTEAIRLIRDLAAALPEGFVDRGDGEQMQGTMFLSFEKGSGEWEIEFCSLDPARNLVATADSLDAVVIKARSLLARLDKEQST